MNRKLICLLVLGIFVFLPAGAMAQKPADPPEVKIPPRYQTPEEIERTQLMDKVDGARYPWECNPDLYDFTSPPKVAFRFPSEYEQTTGVLIGWPVSHGHLIPEITELIRNGIGRMNVTVVTSSRAAVEFYLSQRGFTADDLALISYTDQLFPVNTIWIRDYGPEVVNDENGERHLIDMSYYPGAGNCFPILTRPDDDASPTRTVEIGATKWANYYSRPQIRAEGGAIQTDGAGTCFRTPRNMFASNNFSRWQYTQDQIDEVFGQYLNCSMVRLESLVGGVIDHEDMFMTVISPTKILVGSFNPADDPANAAILDRNAATLEKLGYTVVRIPMPRRYCSSGAFPSTPGAVSVCGAPYNTRVWATYANSIRLNDLMIVPIYRDVPASLRDAILAQEEEALAIYQQELDAEFGKGAVTVVPVNSDRMITGQGSVHCVAMTYQ